MVKWWLPSCRPTVAPVSSTISPARLPSRRSRKPAVSPSGMKQMSWLSGFDATEKPRSAASARTSAFEGVAPSGNMLCAS